MADKYRKIHKPQEELPPNEIRIKRKVGIGRYLKRAHDLLSDSAVSFVTIKAVSSAVESAVKLAELVKHRIAGLHQINKISYTTILDEYEPLEEGLDHLKFTKSVTVLEIKLSKTQLDKKDVGYQPPISANEVQAYTERPEDKDGEARGENNRSKNQRRRKPRNDRRPRTANAQNSAETQNEEKKAPADTPKDTPKDGERKPRRPR